MSDRVGAWLAQHMQHHVTAELELDEAGLREHLVLALPTIYGVRPEELEAQLDDGRGPGCLERSAAAAIEAHRPALEQELRRRRTADTLEDLEAEASEGPPVLGELAPGPPVVESLKVAGVELLTDEAPRSQDLLDYLALPAVHELTRILRRWAGRQALAGMERGPMEGNVGPLLQRGAAWLRARGPGQLVVGGAAMQLSLRDRVELGAELGRLAQLQGEQSPVMHFVPGDELLRRCGRLAEALEYACDLHMSDTTKAPARVPPRVEVLVGGELHRLAELGVMHEGDVPAVWELLRLLALMRARYNRPQLARVAVYLDGGRGMSRSLSVELERQRFEGCPHPEQCNLPAIGFGDFWPGCSKCDP